MIEAFMGEAILFIALISGVTVGDGLTLLALIVAFFLAMMLLLADHLYRAGMPGKAPAEDFR
jgi:hypothetical protein